MRRVGMVFLIVLFAFILCSCNTTTSTDEIINSSETGHLGSENQYVGTWISDVEHGGDLYSFRLLSSGKAIWVKRWGEEGLVTEEDDANSGDWIVDDERIIIFYNTAKGDGAYILDITGENRLEWKGHNYLKVE